MTTSWEAGLLLAAGAHGMGAVVLLLLAPRNRAARWFALFIGTLALWFLVRGLGVPAWVRERESVWVLAVQLVPRALPALFLAFAVVNAREVPARWLAALVVALVALQTALAGTGAAYWLRVALWVGASALIWQHRPRSPSRRPRLLDVTLVLFAPLLALSAWVAGPEVFERLLAPATVGILLVMFVGIARYRLYEVEVRAARSGALLTEAVAQDRLALLGELAASFAHEVRNPLTGVRSLAQRLAEEDVDEPRRRRYAGVIVQEVGRVEALVERLLALARRHPVAAGAAAADVPLAPLLEDVALLADGRAASAGVRVEVSPTPLAVHAVREAVAQVLLNLVLNAVAHAPAGTAVRVGTRVDRAEVVLRVSDEGPGVDAAIRERLFEPFESGRGGAGLGLAVSRRLVEEMGGAIALVASPVGAAFEVRLPAARTAAAPGPGAAGARPSTMGAAVRPGAR